MAHQGPGYSAHREGITTERHDWTMIRAVDLIATQKVIVIDGETPVEEACEILIKNNISSAPVTAPSTDPYLKSYAGMFDYGDLIAYMLIMLKKLDAPLPEENDGFEGDDRLEEQAFEIKELVRRAIGGQSVPVRLASDLSRKNPFYSVMREATLMSVVEEFACGTHRVCVLDQNGDIQGILSQSTIVNYLYKNATQFPELEPLFKKTLRELELGSSPVISVLADSLVLDALAMMSKNGVSSLAVVDAVGMLLGNISMTDVKYVMKSYKHSLLWKTCFQFVGIVRSRQGMEDGQDCYPVFDVRIESTIGFTIAKLIATRAHRVWVTDERGKAMGVVSLTDVLRVFAHYAGLTIGPVRRSSLAGVVMSDRSNSGTPVSERSN